MSTPPSARLAAREPESGAAVTHAAIRPRAFVIGATLVALVGTCQPYMSLVLRSFYTGLGSLPATPLVALLILLGLGGWAARRLGLSKASALAEFLGLELTRKRKLPKAPPEPTVSGKPARQKGSRKGRPR